MTYKLYIWFFLMNSVICVSFLIDSINEFSNNSSNLVYNVPHYSPPQKQSMTLLDHDEFDFDVINEQHQHDATTGYINAEHKIAAEFSKIGQHQRAIDICKNLIKKHSNSVELYNDIAVFHMRDKQYKNACAYLRLAIASGPQACKISLQSWHLPDSIKTISIRYNIIKGSKKYTALPHQHFV